MADLDVRRLGRTEMNPKALGLGCGYVGLPERTSEEEATATIRAIATAALATASCLPQQPTHEPDE